MDIAAAEGDSGYVGAVSGRSADEVGPPAPTTPSPPTDRQTRLVLWDLDVEQDVDDGGTPGQRSEEECTVECGKLPKPVSLQRPLRRLGHSASAPGALQDQGFLLAQQRVQSVLASRRRARRDQRRQKAMATSRFSEVDLDAFLRATQERAKGTQAAVSNPILQKTRSLTDICADLANAEVPQISSGRRLPSIASCSFAAATHTSAGQAWQNPPQATRPAHTGVSTPLCRSLGPAAVTKGRRRIAIVGGGPVGIWAAALIAQRHIRSSGAEGRCKYTRVRDAPDIVIFEARAPSQHCTRRNVRITLSDATVELLNKQTKSEQFRSGMALAEVESLLIQHMRRLYGESIEYCNPILRPDELFTRGRWDMVLWAAGRRSLGDCCRVELGCNMHVAEGEDILVFEMRNFRPRRKTKVCLQELEQLAVADLTGLARQAALREVPRDVDGPCSYRVVMRCAMDNEQPGLAKHAEPICWLWILGLPAELKAFRSMAVERPNGGDRQATHGSLSDALDAEFRRLGLQPDATSWIQRLRAATASLEERVLCPSSVSLRWVDAAYWSSERVVCGLPDPSDPSGRQVPLVLVGDAAMGKPFYVGTTLNVHFAEVKALSKLPVIRWGGATDDENGPADGRLSCYQVSAETAALRPFIAYEQRYRDLVGRKVAHH